ncbi:hypothetical protein [Natrialba asiatica]|uniref:Copper resistance protein d n=1 Tax=Natrialba asiatica (strain ATCC 700177 / DSM 12278 / JCM 9576 / FERM P-10747 / NBRC 102637 / 172P1) TaxID=29540 RepID=M0B5Z2_NATA1|nr:hypothetical protein [Natrialba asiatica]ELZ05937.1 copper resistance protein d [Natrialba asiatica DSM 12278]
MATVTLYDAMRIVHLMTAGVWAGWTVFMAAVVVPTARDGCFDPDGLTRLTGRFSLFSKVAPLIMFFTGMYMIGEGYASDTLLTSARGQLVLTMIGLWIALSILTNVPSRRLIDRIEAIGVEEAARNGWLSFALAGFVSLGLLVVGGLL